MLPEKPKGMGVMIAIGKPKGVPPPLDTPVKRNPFSARNDAQEAPEEEPESKGGSVAPTPESVNYRTEAETCHACEYMDGDQCAFLKIPVSAGDSCSRFESKGEDDQTEHDMGGADLEGSDDGDQFGGYGQ